MKLPRRGATIFHASESAANRKERKRLKTEYLRCRKHMRNNIYYVCVQRRGKLFIERYEIKYMNIQ